MTAKAQISVAPLLVVLLGCTRAALAQAASPEQIAELELFWSYGRSPPVYPSPLGNGTGDWAAAYQQATALVGQMTNEEKQNLTYGYTSETVGCSGISGGAPRVGFPGLCLNDGPAGVRATELVSGYASGIHVGASWNKQLALARGQAMGMEGKRKGVNALLGPCVGPLGRVALGGRNWESFSNDPYLDGALGAETISGLQENIIATVKHFIGNEQETNRNPTDSTGNASVSVNIDDRTIHELYLWPFQDAVKAGVGSVMCSYNRINNSYACQNSKTQNGLLKTELGFQGFVMSDWGGQHTGIASADAGLDMAMPDSDYWNGNLTKAVANGTLAQSRLDDMATRIVATWYKLAKFEPGTGVPVSLLEPHPDQVVTALSPSERDTIFQGAVEGHVLVKNTNNALPLKSPKILSFYGYDAVAAKQSYPTSSFSRWSSGAESVNVTDADLITLFTDPSKLEVPPAAYAGTLISGGGSGSVTPPYVNAPYDAFQQRAYEDNTMLLWDFESQDPTYDPASDAAIVFINTFATEGLDRTVLTDDWSDVLVENVASKSPNTIVVIHNAGIRLVDAWIEHPNVTAVIYAHLPGQDSGRALVEVMYGAQSPSGRLPYTVAKKSEDYGALLKPVVPDNSSDYYTQDNFTEGLYIDYRHFAAQNITPRFPFGFGLTYTTFTYANLAANLTSSSSLADVPPAAPVLEGGIATLWDTLATVTATITNAGDVEAAEVAQLYVGIPAPGTPARQLRGFDKVALAPGESADVAFALTRRDLSVWDAGRQSWVLPRGEFGVFVGASVEDVRLTGSFVVE